MKKKIIIPVILLFIIIIVFISFNIFSNKIVSTITLDINPSIEINLDKFNKIVKVDALNKEANDIISNNLKGKKLDDALKIIRDNLINKGYIDNSAAIILYSKGNINNEELKVNIENIFNEKHVFADIIVIDNITKEDENLAKLYHISPAKASYIKSISNDNISIEDISNKSVNELKETKERRLYCPKDYILEGDWCIKEIDIVEPINGEVCESGYLDYNGKCYEEGRSEETGNLICRDEFELENGKCVRKRVVDASVSSYSCPSGEVRTKGEVGMAPKGSGDSNEPVCVDPNSITHPVTVCELPANDPTERLSSGGNCYWHRAPVIESGCPGKVQVDGFCWDLATNIYLCPYGNNSNPRTKDDYCYTVLKGVNATPTEYKCDEENMKLEGNKCILEEVEDAMHELTCKNGYTLVNNDRCVNLNNTTNKVNGLICDENSKLKNNKCIVYDFIEAIRY